MISPFSLPMLGASLLAAVVVGVHLGESSVGLINPIYFQEPPLHPRDRGVAIDQAGLNRNGPAFAEHYGWEQGYAARAADCGNCEALHARDAYAYSAEIPYFGSGKQLRSAVAIARDELGERFAALPADVSPRDAEVERYAHYRIAEEPESEVEPEPELAVEEVVPASDAKSAEFEEF